MIRLARQKFACAIGNLATPPNIRGIRHKCSPHFYSRNCLNSMNVSGKIVNNELTRRMLEMVNLITKAKKVSNTNRRSCGLVIK